MDSPRAHVQHPASGRQDQVADKECPYNELYAIRRRVSLGTDMVEPRPSRHRYSCSRLAHFPWNSCGSCRVA
jgi:hypothetical protein